MLYEGLTLRLDWYWHTNATINRKKNQKRKRVARPSAGQFVERNNILINTPPYILFMTVNLNIFFFIFSKPIGE